MKLKSIEALFAATDQLYEEAARVANILKSYDDNCACTFVIDSDNIRYETQVGLYADLEWDNCSRGCCGRSKYELFIPTKYLYNEELIAELEKEVAAKKSKAEKEVKKQQAARKAADTKRRKLEYEKFKKEFENE